MPGERPRPPTRIGAPIRARGRVVVLQKRGGGCVDPVQLPQSFFDREREREEMRLFPPPPLASTQQRPTAPIVPRAGGHRSGARAGGSRARGTERRETGVRSSSLKTNKALSYGSAFAPPDALGARKSVVAARQGHDDRRRRRTARPARPPWPRRAAPPARWPSWLFDGERGGSPSFC